jgi:hypothetical protein
MSLKFYSTVISTVSFEQITFINMWRSLSSFSRGYCSF